MTFSGVGAVPGAVVVCSGGDGSPEPPGAELGVKTPEYEGQQLVMPLLPYLSPVRPSLVG